MIHIVIFINITIILALMRAKTVPKKDPLPKELFEVLACPMCKSDLEYNPGKTGLVCVKCKENYPIKNGIPVLLPKGME